MLRLSCGLMLMATLVTTFGVLRAHEVAVDRVVIQAHESLPLHAVGAQVRLPMGSWEIANRDALAELGVIAPVLVQDPVGESARPQGRRARMAKRESASRLGSSQLHRIYWALRQEQDPEKSQYGVPTSSEAELARSPWESDPSISAAGPFFFRVPGVEVSQGRVDSPEVIVIELRPLVDDGRHHVLLNNGRVDRRAIDWELLARHGIDVVPIYPSGSIEEDRREEQVVAILLGLADVPHPPISIELRHISRPDTRTCVLDPSTAQRDPTVLEPWVSARAAEWIGLEQRAPSSALSCWVRSLQRIHGVEIPSVGRLQRNRRGETTSIFNVIGGRAAIRETLQMQVIQAGHGADPSERTIPVTSIEGVAVKAHNYEEMLSRVTGGELRLARAVPHDRFFVYFAQPRSIAAALRGGNDFIFELSRTFTNSSLKYHLKRRYLAKLGMTPEWVSLLLETNAVQEMGLIFPDLFFIDGTDLTVVMRVPRLAAFGPLLNAAGVKGLESGKVVTKSLPNGDKVYWAAQGTLLFVSSFRGELDRCLALVESGGKNSLGESAEFRYMLTKLPTTEKTQAYAFLSDPFIRRLTGPQVKIAQYRRARARADLEALSAARLLCAADGGHGAYETQGIDQLVSLGYAAPHLARSDYSISADHVASSAEYGTPSDMTTVLEMDVQRVSPEEQSAYKTYVRQYSQFWRQFFDPIAIRVDDLGSGDYELEVFILPLINSSIYDMVRGVVTPHGQGAPLRVPQFEHDPVLMFSVNVPDPAWVEIVRDLSRMTERLGVSSRLFDELGPSVHLAVLDGDPVINLGSGDLLGAFGGGGMNGMFRRQEAFMIPVLLSTLTRPCKLLVELRDSEKVAGIIRDATRHARAASRWDFSLDFAEVTDNSWMLTMDIFNMVKLRFGIEVRDGFLVISNIPWSQSGGFQGYKSDVLDGVALQVNPGVGQLQLPGLFASAKASERDAAFGSTAYLLPLLLAGAENVRSAQAWHRRIFGFEPVHPDRGSWTWQNQTLTSDHFGSPGRQRQPAYLPGDREFGAMRQIDDLTVSLQLEDDGLRTRFQWSIRTE